MDVLTDTMSTTQMQSKTGRVDSYDAMVEAERKMNASYDFFAGYKTGKASQAAVKAENDAYDDEEDAIRRDASDDLYAGYRVGKASQARYKTWKASHIRRDAFDDTRYAKYKAGKVLQAAVEAENDAYDDEEDAIRRDASDDFYAGYRIGLSSIAKESGGLAAIRARYITRKASHIRFANYKAEKALQAAV